MKSKTLVYFGCPTSKVNIEELYLRELGKRVAYDYEVVFFQDWQLLSEAFEKNLPEIIIIPRLMFFNRDTISLENMKEEIDNFFSKKKKSKERLMLTNYNIDVDIYFSQYLHLSSSLTNNLLYTTYHGNQVNMWCSIINSLVREDYYKILGETIITEH